MADENRHMMKLAEEKKRKLEEQLEKLKGDNFGLVGEQAKQVEKNLDLLKKCLCEGVENLTGKETQKLKQWFPENVSPPDPAGKDTVR